MSYSEPGTSPSPGQPPYAAAPTAPAAPAAAPYAAAQPEQAQPGQAHPGQPFPGRPFPGQPGYPGQPMYPGQPVYPGPPPPMDVLRSPQGLSTALTVLFCVAAAIGLFSAGANLLSWSLRNGAVAEPAAGSGDSLSLDLADVLTGLGGALQLLSMVGTAAVFITWFHRVRVNGGIFRPDCFTQDRGWAIGAWFIPIGNLFLPYRTARQIWTASTQLGPDGSYRHVSSAPVTAWWVLWVAALIADRVHSRMSTYAETTEAIRNAAAVGVVASLLLVAAAVLAALFVRKLTALQNTKAAQGPYAAA